MITYDAEGRAYYEGKRIARTTEVCALLAPRTWNADEYYLRKGTLIHRICEWEDSGELDESSVDPNLAGYLSAYRQFKKDTGWLNERLEKTFIHKGYGYCGRADRVGRLAGIWTWVLDIKSGQFHNADQYQAPAYLFGLQYEGIRVQRCGDLYLKHNGTYRFTEVKNPTEKFFKFLEGLKKWREENNGNR